MASIHLTVSHFWKNTNTTKEKIQSSSAFIHLLSLPKPYIIQLHYYLTDDKVNNTGNARKGRM